MNRKATAGTFLLGYSYIASDHALAKRVIGMIEPLADAQALSPLNELWWRARVAYYSWHRVEYEQALRAIEDAQDSAGRHGLVGLQSAEPVVNLYAALVALSRGDLTTAEERVQKLERLLKPDRRMDLFYLNEAKTCLALCKRDTRLSQELAQATLDVAVQTGMTYIEGLALLMLAHALVQLAKYEDALRATARARELTEHTVLRHLTSECLLIDAYVAWKRDDETQCVSLLGAALQRAKETDYVFWYRWVPDVLPGLCAKALSIGLQPDFVRDVIRRFQLSPPDACVQNWPWPLSFVTFGQVVLRRGGVPVELSKRARKPLELLKAIIVCGGENVDVLSLAEMLWPDADGDAAQKAFDITLHRLRKQLAVERALILQRGTISIDRKILWVDAAAFRDLADRIDALDSKHELRNAVVLNDLYETLIELYRGSFLAADPDLSWAIPARDRLHARFVRALTALGRAYETIGDYEHAILLYRHGLQMDQAAELLYQRLIVCCQKSGRVAEAVEAYERCRVALSSLIERRPSVETEALRRSITTIR